MKNSITTGKIKFYNDEKGYGFIVPDNGDKDVFFHFTSIESEGIQLKHIYLKDKKVSYTMRDGKKGPEAVDVVISD
jgi:CspA family cold shock protein